MLPISPFFIWISQRINFLSKPAVITWPANQKLLITWKTEWVIRSVLRLSWTVSTPRPLECHKRLYHCHKVALGSVKAPDIHSWYNSSALACGYHIIISFMFFFTFFFFVVENHETQYRLKASHWCALNETKELAQTLDINHSA